MLMLLQSRAPRDHLNVLGVWDDGQRKEDFFLSASPVTTEERCGLFGRTRLPDTEGGTRTLTPLRETDFESVASANSATPACLCIIPYSAANDKSGTDP
jgi:hypothetical protein